MHFWIRNSFSQPQHSCCVWVNCYRPQTKFAKVMFLHMSVCPQWELYSSMPCRWYPSMPCRFLGGGCIKACLAGFQAHIQGELEGSGHLGGVSRLTLGGSPGPYLGGVSQHALRQTPPADGYCCGIHPTGMHSCL